MGIFVFLLFAAALYLETGARGGRYPGPVGGNAS